MKALSSGDLSRNAVVAAAVRLIDKLGCRVGTERYLEENGTRGVSTLAPENVEECEDHRLSIEYVGKGGTEVSTSLNDPLLAEAVAECHELGGHRLFTYRTKEGDSASISSSDVNEFLSEVYDRTVTAKDLRTWRASAEVVEFLRKIKHPEDREEEIREAIHHAAEEIHNTYETCRKHYVHPKILDAYRGSRSRGFSLLRPPAIAELQRSESLLLRLLKS